MSGQVLSAAAPWFGVALTVVFAVVAVTALTARSLFVMASALAAVAALGSASVLTARGGESALALAALAGVAPVLLFAGVLLSARTAKPSRRIAWLALVASVAGAGLFAFLAPELEEVATTVTHTGRFGFWLAVLIFVAAIGCVGLLAYGERGVLARPPSELEP
jgi:hypothetical protein